jgi:hypothetical protein
MSSTAPHKLVPRSSLCIFLGFSSEHKGSRCLELESNRILTSRHVVFMNPSSLSATCPPRPWHPPPWTFLLMNKISPL